jgi:hypothetical protein
VIWEIYRVEQRLGTAVWLVKVNGNGSIQRVEVAVRQ